VCVPPIQTVDRTHPFARLHGLRTLGVLLAGLASGCLGILGVSDITAAPDATAEAKTSEMDAENETSKEDAGTATLQVAWYAFDGSSGVMTLTPPGPGEGGTILVKGNLGSASEAAGNVILTYEVGTEVKVLARPSRGSTFGGWSGACASGDGPTCAVTIVANTFPTLYGAFNSP
jgi:hypothetical protein